MALESATFIDGLVATNPTSSDNVSDGDNHIRLLKTTIKASFPSITGAMDKSHTQLNTAVDDVEAATNANTASTIVKRNASGNFAAGTITAALTGNVTGNLTGNVTGDVTGNADTATTWETSRTVTLTGDVSGSATGVDGGGDVSITTTVADDSHNHTIANVDGLQTTLDNMLTSSGNIETASRWLNARTISLSGDLSGSVSINGSADVTLSATVADDSHNHTIANVDGLQTALDGKLGTSGNAASATKWDNARTISLGGDLSGSASVDGTADVTLTAAVSDNSHNHTITNVTGLQSALDDKLESSDNIATASKWQTARTITLGGDLTGSVSVDGSANVTLTAAVSNNSHDHTIANITGLQTALDGKLGSTATATDSTKWGGYNVSTAATGSDSNTIYFRT